MAHDLHDYMKQISLKMEAEYNRIRKSAAADPGTAGDEGEENWAQLFREWLPPTYRVVTKGQLVDESGNLSPQVDVIVLKPSYPNALHHKKKYFLAGVAAAFECKLTLKKAGIAKAIQTAAAIKRLAGSKQGTPYQELVSGPIVGILAHAHAWKGSDIDAIKTVDEHIRDSDLAFVKHPRETADFVCVTNLATWVMSKDPLVRRAEKDDPVSRARIPVEGGPSTTYFCHAPHEQQRDTASTTFTPIGVLVGELLVKLAWEDVALRDIAGYFIGVELSNASSGTCRYWSRNVYSSQLRRKISAGRLRDVITWDEWAVSIE
jgi:hypothetical protein